MADLGYQFRFRKDILAPPLPDISGPIKGTFS